LAEDAELFTARTTEHFGLADWRSQAAAESASPPSALFLGSARVGLGLTAQVSSAFSPCARFMTVAGAPVGKAYPTGSDA
jgi:hypothetical protein